MERKAVELDLGGFPPEVRGFLAGARLYDSSGHEAQTLFADKDEGYFVKIKPAGALAEEAALARYFHAAGLSAAVCAYISADRDYLVTARLPGEDATMPCHLAQPERLCDAFAESLWRLHQTPREGCPVPDRMTPMLAEVERIRAAGTADPWLLSYVGLSPDDPEGAYRLLQEGRHLLRQDALLHGDACLPNALFTPDWRCSGWVDVGNAGIGDRHYDLLWSIWSLGFNLKTEAYRERFLDAYGRAYIDDERLRLCGIVAALSY